MKGEELLRLKYKVRIHRADWEEERVKWECKDHEGNERRKRGEEERKK